MTPAQLDTIAAEAAGGCSTCVELVAEVRRLQAALQQAELYCDDTRKVLHGSNAALLAAKERAESAEKALEVLVQRQAAVVAERDKLRAALQLVFGDGVHRGGISVAAWVAVRDALAAHPAPDALSDKESR